MPGRLFLTVLAPWRHPVPLSSHQRYSRAHLVSARGLSDATSERLSYMHRPGSEPLLYLSLGQLAARSARRYGQREALVSVEEGVRLTYPELLRKADCLAAGLRRLGLRSGDRVAIWGPNSWRWVVTKIALARAGMVSVDMNPLYREQEVLHCLSLARVAAVVAADKHRDICYHSVLSAVAPELLRSEPGGIQSAALPALRSVISMAGTPPPGCMTFDDVLSSATPDEVLAVEELGRDITPESAGNIQFSSGTTGKPKAIVVSHMGVVNNGLFNGRGFCFHEKSHKVCLQAPLFHAYGSVVILSSVLNHGATLVLPAAGYDPKRAIAAVASEKCSVMTGTPTMYVDLVRIVQEQGAVLDSLELAITGGAPITPEFVRRMKTTLGVKRLCSVYGLSETTAVVFLGTPNDTEQQMAETVGRLSDHIEAKVVDTDNRMVPFGMPGELLVRGYTNMICYFQNEAATKNTVVDGWVRTGDKFVLHEDGYGRIVGRIKDLVIRGGENIYPKEIEDAITTHPDIREAEVVGVPDERLGEEICACIKVPEGASVSAKDLRAFLKGKIATYKVPRYCVTLQDFPKTLSGKIQKNKLRDGCTRLLAEGRLDDSSKR